TAAYAGGMDRSGQSITALFEEGTYAEISFGSVSPDVTGVDALTAPSGNAAPSYTQVGLAFKTDINDKVSLAFIMDQPFGASLDYATAGYLLTGTTADVTSNGFTLLGQYQINDNVSVYAGPRYITAEGEFHRRVSIDPTADYDASYAKADDLGYVIGAAYELPEIALRAAITYSSTMTFEMAGSGTGSPVTGPAGDLTASMPQTVNLDFQTGIAADTLAFATIRWADWSEASLVDSNPAAGVLSEFGNVDSYTYTLGVGRRFTDSFAAQISLGYEETVGEPVSDLTPTDGYTSVSIGGAYTLESGLEISGGVRYVFIGDADTDNGSSFTDNSVTAIGLKLAYNY
ncbi:MAG: transporter, partial [Marivivens sp.]|nr:transporter [Marivivens sp.]